MSIAIDYFFNADDDFATLLSRFSQTLGIHFAPYENDPSDQYCRFLGMEFSFQEHHELENDGDCHFENYKFHLDTPNINDMRAFVGSSWLPDD